LNIAPDDELARRTVGRSTGRAWSCLLERARARQGWAQLAVPLTKMSLDGRLLCTLCVGKFETWVLLGDWRRIRVVNQVYGLGVSFNNQHTLINDKGREVFIIERKRNIETARFQMFRTVHYLVKAKPTSRQMVISMQFEGNVHRDSMFLARFHTNHGNL
jgi:hypothetical protein